MQMRKCLLAMLILMLVILMLILMLLNLNTGYADCDADLCIRIMCLCCICRTQYKQGKTFIMAIVYALGRQYVPRVPAYMVAGDNMCSGDKICRHNAFQTNKYI